MTVSGEKLYLSFLNHGPFTRKELKKFYEGQGENPSDLNLNVRISRLKEKGVISSFRRGLYILNQKKQFEPEVDKILRTVSNNIQKEFPFLTYSVWTTGWLNELMTLQLLREIYVLEVESGSEENVFRTMKENFSLRVFLKPSENEWEKYGASNVQNMLINSMISESPQKTFRGVPVAKLEKILVDLYCDKFWKSIFVSELENIYSEACTLYALNFSTLLSYAARRGKRNEIAKYIRSLSVLDKGILKFIK